VHKVNGATRAKLGRLSDDYETVLEREREQVASTLKAYRGLSLGKRKAKVLI
jgi:hypothetical protein